MNEARDFTYLNEVRVSVALGPAPDDPPDEVWLHTATQPVVEGRENWSETELTDALARIPYVITQASHPATYVLDVRKSHYSWGADAAAAEVALYVAGHLLDAGIGALVTEAVHRAFKSIRVHESDVEYETYVKGLKSRAKWLVRTHFKMHKRKLHLVAERKDNGAQQYEYVFHDKKGWEYTVKFGVFSDLPASTYVGRKRAPNR